MKASSQPRRASSRRLEGPFSRGFLGVLVLALELLLPTCSDACDDSPRYQSMKIKGQPSPPYSAGNSIEYECRPGYKRIVPPLPVQTVCQDDGTWAPALQEACTKKTCQQIGELLNGEVIYTNGNTEFGSQVQFTCHDGFYLLGPKILYCELSGDKVEWSENAPACEKILCKPPANIQNGIFSNSHKDTFEYNEIVTYSCRPSGGPDEYSLVGESKLICVGRDKWSSEPPECKVVRCIFPVVQDGKVISGFGKKFPYKAEVRFECNAGFRLEGSNTIVCGADNTWKPNIPKCVKGTTPKPPGTSSSHSDLSPAVPTTTKQQPAPHTAPDDDIPAKGHDLGAGLVAVITLTILFAVALFGTCLYKFLHVRKR